MRFTRLMPYLLSFLLSSIVFLGSVTSLPPTLSSSSLAALPIVRDIFAGSPPPNLGVNQGNLASCPTSPNCVLSQAADASHAIAPLVYQGDRPTAKETLLKVLSVVPNTQVVEETDDYIHAESSSRIMGFVDDVEFYLPKSEKIIHIRSASRLGESDLGVNRRRIEQIRLALADLQA